MGGGGAAEIKVKAAWEIYFKENVKERGMGCLMELLTYDQTYNLIQKGRCTGFAMIFAFLEDFIFLSFEKSNQNCIWMT